MTQTAGELAKAEKIASAALGDMLAALSISDDPRAKPLKVALNAQNPDAADARALLGGTGQQAGDSRMVLASWAALKVPDEDTVNVAALALAEAAERDRQIAAGAAGRARRLADLLDLAVEHREHVDDLCPVCGQGRLDNAWLTAAKRESREHRRQAAAATTARTALQTARTAARRLITTPPEVAKHPAVDGIDPALAAAAWADFHALDDPSMPDEVRDRRTRTLVGNVLQLHSRHRLQHLDREMARASHAAQVQSRVKKLEKIEKVGISMKEVTDNLVNQAVKLFVEPFDKLLSFMIVYLIIQLLPQRLLQRFPNTRTVNHVGSGR